MKHWEQFYITKKKTDGQEISKNIRYICFKVTFLKDKQEKQWKRECLVSWYICSTAL